jgi:hypothetical protein
METTSIRLSSIREKGRTGLKLEDADIVWGANDIEAWRNFAKSITSMSDARLRETVNLEEKAKRAG